MLDPRSTLAMRISADKSLEKGQKLVSGLPYISAIDDVTLMLRDGDLMASFVVEGINSDTAETNHVSDSCEGFSRFIAQQRNNVGYYIHQVSMESKPELSPIKGHSFHEELDSRWQHYLKTTGLRERVNMVTVVMRKPKKITKLLHIFDRDDSFDRAEILARAKKLDELIATFMSICSQAKPRRMSVADGQWLGILSSLIDGQPHTIIPSQKFIPIADRIASASVKFSGDKFIVKGPTKEQKRYGAIISIKDYPTQTYPGILDNLKLHHDTVVTHSFTPINNLTAQNRIARVQNQMKAAEDAAVSLLTQLEEAEDDVASGRTVFGEHHCSVAIFCSSYAELEEAVSSVTRALQGVGAAIVREGFCARAVYFAQHPGNFSYRTRPAMISSHNFAHLSAMHGQSKGHMPERCPWGDAVTTLPTARGETFRFNFHLAGKLNERTVGHTLILGQTGSGKTLGTAFLLSQAKRIDPRIIIFDKDNGFEMAVRAMGGDYSSVRMGIDTNFNPIRAEADTRGAAWLSDWLTAMADNEGPHLNANQIQALEDAVQANISADPRLQNFEQFHNQLRATDDEGDLYSRLGRWDKEGQFGWLFSGKEVDPLSFKNNITAFDLTEIFDNDVVRTAWLSYVFRRSERMVEDESPTLIVLDEAWKLLDDPYFEKRLKEWMLTMRKKNVAVILLTQRVSHITESVAGSAILESAVTRLVYPNSFNTEQELAPLNLTSIESDFLRSTNIDNHLALYKSGADSVVLDFDLTALGGALDVLGGGHGEKGPKGWRENPKFYEEMMQ